MIRLALVFLSSLTLTLVIMPLTIKTMKRLKCGQTVLHYVEDHKGKSGTPTMGGIAFVISTSVVCLFFSGGNSWHLNMCVAVFVAFAVLGFLDDFIKVRYKQNKGLSPLQKIAFQVIVAVIVSLFAYFSALSSDKLILPFGFKTIRIGVLAIPLYIFVFLALGNAVNLIDGLDGLAAKVTTTYSVAFIILLLLVVSAGVFVGFESEVVNVVMFCVAITGSLIAFSCYNSFPARIFMGDTGALALGGGLATVAITTNTALFVIVIGIAYVITCLSVIIQVVYFKLTRKRVFIMTPIHHHFEKRGVHENVIVSRYVALTAIAGAISIISFLL